PGALDNLARDYIADSTEFEFTRLHVAFNLLAILWSRAFRYHYQTTEPTRGISFFDRVRDLVVIKRNLRNQNNVSAAGDSTMQCNPARMSSHHFDNHDAFVARRRRMQSIERVHHFGDRGIETE